MTVTSRAGILSGNQNAAPIIPMSARALDGHLILAPAHDAISVKRMQSNILLGPNLNGVSFSYLRAEAVVDQWVERTLIDSAFLPTGYDYDAFEDQVYNLSAGSDYRQWCVSEDAIPPDGETYYFEVATIAGSTNVNGYVAVVQESTIASTYDNQNPVYAGQVGYRGNGTIWSDANQQSSLGSSFSFGNGSLVRMAFNASSGALWVGLNGTWHRDPATESPSFTFDPSDAGVTFRAAIQGRDQGDRAQLRGRLQQFRYAPPSGCLPLKS